MLEEGHGAELEAVCSAWRIPLVIRWWAFRLKTDLGVFLQIFFCSICKMGMWVGLQKKPGLREGFVACKELVGWRHRFFCMAAAAKPRGAARSAAEGEPLMPKGYDGH